MDCPGRHRSALEQRGGRPVEDVRNRQPILDPVDVGPGDPLGQRHLDERGDLGIDMGIERLDADRQLHAERGQQSLDHRQAGVPVATLDPRDRPLAHPGEFCQRALRHAPTLPLPLQRRADHRGQPAFGHPADAALEWRGSLSGR